MKKSTAKIVSIVICLVMVAMMIFAATMVTSAANTDDTYFQVSLNTQYNRIEQFTPIRAKTNTTSVYLKSGSAIVGSFLAFPWGCYSGTYVQNENVTNNDNRVTCANQVVRLRSNIYETGFRYAAIQFQLYTSSSGSSYVAWSPDSMTWS